MKTPGKIVLAYGCVATAMFAQQESILIGPGDRLSVHVFDTPELDQTARVTDKGDLPLLLGGSIQVGSMSPSEAASAIEKKLIETQTMYHPRVLVTVDAYATQNVTVLGQVLNPGSYQIATPRSALDVLALAGGLTDLADRKVTVVHRNGAQQEVFVSNDPAEEVRQNILVYPGDRLLVPKAGIVYVLGDVGRPGGFPMTNNDSRLTVLQAVAIAGGTAHTAVSGQARLLRNTAAGGTEEITISITDMQKGKKPDMTMQASDILYVPFSFFRNAALSMAGIAAAATSAVIYIH